MSWALLREAQKDRTLGARQLGRRQVLAFLARRADDDGRARVGSRVVADETGLEHRHVRRLLNDLAEMGRIDLVDPGASGRGRAHTWRVLSMAEWSERRAEKAGSTPPFRAEGKGGLGAGEKGATSPPLELPQELPPLPPRRSAPRREAAATPPLPGLGRGEEGMASLGGRSRAAGNSGARHRGDRHVVDRRVRLDEERHAELVAQVDESIALSQTPEAIAAREELRDRWFGRRAAGAAG